MTSAQILANDEKTVLSKMHVSMPWQAWFAIAAQLPLLFVMLWSNLDEPHYQFSILVPFVVLFLCRQRALETHWNPRGSISWLAMVIWLLAWLLFAASVLIMSPWLVAVASLITGGAIACSIGGVRLLRCVAPVGLLWCLIIPLPLGLDASVIQSLQLIASEMASLLLDAFGIMHLLHGTVIEIPGTQYLVEEACSGINSLYASTAIVVVFLLWRQARWYMWIVYGLLTVGWVICMNAIRVFTVVVAGEKWQVDLDTGWRHDAVGAILFLGILLMLWSSDRMVRFIVPRQPKKQALSSSKSILASRAWNWVALVFVFPAVLLAIRFTEASHVLERGSLENVTVPSTEFGTLPSKLVGFTRTGELDRVERDTESLEGERSLQWAYQRSGLQATVSLDYSFINWHYHVNCYPAQGWEILDHDVLRNGQTTVAVRMKRGATEYGWLIYAMFDETGTAISPRLEKGLAEKTAGKIDRLKQRLPGWLGGATQESQRTYMLRVFVASGQPTTDDAIRDTSRLFHEVNELLHEDDQSNQR